MARTVDPGSSLTIVNFRSFADLTLRLDPPLVIVGADGTPTAGLLRPVRALTDPTTRLTPADFRDPARSIELELRDADGGLLTRLTARQRSGTVLVRRVVGDRPAIGPVLHLGSRRLRGLRFDGIQAMLRRRTDASRRREVCDHRGERSDWLLIEWPELFLGPQSQRALASQLRAFAACGHQVIYTTRSPNLIDSAHPDGIVRVVQRRPDELSVIQAPHTPPSDVPDLVRHLASFDRERNAMFFASRVLLVEGASERLSLPFAFRLLGHEPDVEGIAIIDAGGKGNLSFLATTLRSLAIPTVVLHDRDAAVGEAPLEDEIRLNAAIAEAAGSALVVEMAPDFEGISGLPAHHRRKPVQAWRRYAAMRDAAELPGPVVEAIERLIRVADPAGLPAIA